MAITIADLQSGSKKLNTIEISEEKKTSKVSIIFIVDFLVHVLSTDEYCFMRVK